MEIKEKLKNYSEVEQKIMNPPFPKNVLMEITNMCNHSCIFCANSKSSRKRGMIDRSIAIKILKEAYDLGAREVGFYSTGEPLVNKELETYISHAKKIGYTYTYITTNGALLDAERIKSITDAGIDSIKFSINASNKESYKFIHGKDDFDKVLLNLKKLWEFRKKNNINYKIYVSSILTKYTNDEAKIRKLVDQYVDHIIVLNCINQGGNMHELNQYLLIENSKPFLDKNQLCPLLFNTAYISWEGYLTMCCVDFQNYLAVEDLNKVKLEDAWNNEYAKQLRSKHLNKKYENTLCYNCIHNCNTEVEPVRKDLATELKFKDWNKTDEILNRISVLENTK